jgi:hypothetical protein
LHASVVRQPTATCVTDRDDGLMFPQEGDLKGIRTVFVASEQAPSPQKLCLGGKVSSKVTTCVGLLVW